MRWSTLASVLLLPTAAAADPDLRFTLGGGLATAPAYFGSDEYTAGPTGSVSLGYLRAGGLSFGALEGGETRGFSIGGAFRTLPERRAADYPELAGLNDIDAAYELGLSAGWTEETWSLFGSLRYGLGGHESLVATIGSDAILRPTDRLTLRAGPRMDIGSSGFNQTYFGVTAAEAGASAFPAYDAGGGLYSVGIELEAEYDVSPAWSVAAGLGYDRLVGDAALSPIVQDEDRWTASVVLRRTITLDF